MSRTRLLAGPSRRGRWALAFTVCAAAATLYIWSGADPDSQVPSPPPHAPSALWDAPLLRCSRLERRAAGQLARRQAELAELKRARGRFSVRDTMLAVPHHERAAACFRAAGDLARAAEQAALARALRTELSAEFRRRQLQLEYALQIRDWPAVSRRARRLRELLRDRPCDYDVWLSSIQRRASVERGPEEP